MSPVVPENPRSVHTPVLALAALIMRADNINDHLITWASRPADPTVPDAAARQAANDAVIDIDRSLQTLYQIRARLVDEIRTRDDARQAARTGGAR